jgi:U3 small nucleolar RNA-associated protein 10
MFLAMQLLMATRDGDVRARRRALAVVSRLIATLGEEYGLLLPEALPFLSELLEDEDASVAAAAAGLVANLETLTGEPFDQYLRA